MILVDPKDIREIDRYAIEELAIPERELIEKSGRAVAKAVEELVKPGTKVAVIVGSGNNGADGYAAARELKSGYDVAVCDLFGKGQKGECGRAIAEAYEKDGGKILSPAELDGVLAHLTENDALVDAVFGTGFSGELPQEIRDRLPIWNALPAKKVAVDLPLGVNAATGEAEADALRVDTTVELSFIKRGVASYPAKDFCGRIVLDTLGLPVGKIAEKFGLSEGLVDAEYCKKIFPKRAENTNKGSFGKVLLVTGSDRYPGAADLTVSSALRGGAGSVYYYGSRKLCRGLLKKYPEVLYKKSGKTLTFSDGEIEEILALSEGFSAILVGSGCGVSEGLYRLVISLLKSGGCPLILDADAINTLAKYSENAIKTLAESKRRVILTPHPLEFSRLVRASVDEVQSRRIPLARDFAAAANCTLILKGAATLIAGEERLLINGSGNNALAKAGSGDTLAGLLSSLVASGAAPLDAAALAVFVHGRAGERLAEKYSKLGVLPSELPAAMAEEFAALSAT